MQAAVFGHSIDFENAKTFDHGRFKDERPVNEYLHLEPQAVSRCVSLPVRHGKERQVQYGDHQWSKLDQGSHDQDASAQVMAEAE